MRVMGFLILALISTPLSAQEAVPDPADGYPMEPKYTDGSADLPKEGASDGVPTKPEPPMLLDAKGQPARFSFISLEPGQTLLFRIFDGKVTDVRLVDADTALMDGEIRVTMDSTGGNTMLTVLNQGPMAYNYTAVMLPSIDADTGKQTSVCTLMAGLTAFEMWPYPIPAIAVGEFTPAPDDEMVCK